MADKKVIIRFDADEFSRLALLVDEMSRLHVPGMALLCKAATESTEAMLAAMVEVADQVRKAREREHRQHLSEYPRPTSSRKAAISASKAPRF